MGFATSVDLSNVYTDASECNKLTEYYCNICHKPESEVGDLMSGRVSTGLDYKVCRSCMNSIIFDKLSEPVPSEIDLELEYNKLLIKVSLLQQRIDVLLDVLYKLNN
jgi:hypothetical protein